MEKKQEKNCWEVYAVKGELEFGEHYLYLLGLIKHRPKNKMFAYSSIITEAAAQRLQIS